jgi:hypothetical protein
LAAVLGFAERPPYRLVESDPLRITLLETVLAGTIAIAESTEGGFRRLDRVA